MTNNKYNLSSILKGKNILFKKWMKKVKNK